MTETTSTALATATIATHAARHDGALPHFAHHPGWTLGGYNSGATMSTFASPNTSRPLLVGLAAHPAQIRQLIHAALRPDQAARTLQCWWHQHQHRSSSTGGGGSARILTTTATASSFRLKGSSSAAHLSTTNTNTTIQAPSLGMISSGTETSTGSGTNTTTSSRKHARSPSLPPQQLQHPRPHKRLKIGSGVVHEGEGSAQAMVVESSASDHSLVTLTGLVPVSTFALSQSQQGGFRLSKATTTTWQEPWFWTSLRSPSKTERHGAARVLHHVLWQQHPRMLHKGLNNDNKEGTDEQPKPSVPISDSTSNYSQDSARLRMQVLQWLISMLDRYVVASCHSGGGAAAEWALEWTACILQDCLVTTCRNPDPVSAVVAGATSSKNHPKINTNPLTAEVAATMANSSSAPDVKVAKKVTIQTPPRTTKALAATATTSLSSSATMGKNTPVAATAPKSTSKPSNNYHYHSATTMMFWHYWPWLSRSIWNVAVAQYASSDRAATSSTILPEALIHRDDHPHCDSPQDHSAQQDASMVAVVLHALVAMAYTLCMTCTVESAAHSHDRWQQLLLYNRHGLWSHRSSGCFATSQNIHQQQQERELPNDEPVSKKLRAAMKSTFSTAPMEIDSDESKRTNTVPIPAPFGRNVAATSSNYNSTMGPLACLIGAYYSWNDQVSTGRTSNRAAHGALKALQRMVDPSTPPSCIVAVPTPNGLTRNKESGKANSMGNKSIIRTNTSTLRKKRRRAHIATRGTTSRAALSGIAETNATTHSLTSAATARRSGHSHHHTRSPALAVAAATTATTSTSSTDVAVATAAVEDALHQERSAQVRELLASMVSEAHPYLGVVGDGAVLCDDDDDEDDDDEDDDDDEMDDDEIFDDDMDEDYDDDRAAGDDIVDASRQQQQDKDDRLRLIAAAELSILEAQRGRDHDDDEDDEDEDEDDDDEEDAVDDEDEDDEDAECHDHTEHEGVGDEEEHEDVEGEDHDEEATEEVDHRHLEHEEDEDDVPHHDGERLLMMAVHDDDAEEEDDDHHRHGGSRDDDVDEDDNEDEVPDGDAEEEAGLAEDGHHRNQGEHEDDDDADDDDEGDDDDDDIVVEETEDGVFVHRLGSSAAATATAEDAAVVRHGTRRATRMSALRRLILRDAQSSANRSSTTNEAVIPVGTSSSTNAQAGDGAVVSTQRDNRSLSQQQQPAAAPPSQAGNQEDNHADQEDRISGDEDVADMDDGDDEDVEEPEGREDAVAITGGINDEVLLFAQSLGAATAATGQADVDRGAHEGAGDSAVGADPALALASALPNVASAAEGEREDQHVAMRLADLIRSSPHVLRPNSAAVHFATLGSIGGHNSGETGSQAAAAHGAHPVGSESQDEQQHSLPEEALVPDIPERQRTYISACMQVMAEQYPHVQHQYHLHHSQSGHAGSGSYNGSNRRSYLSLAAENRMLESINKIIKPPKTPLNVKIIMRRAPTQEEFFRGSLSRNPIGLSNLRPSRREAGVAGGGNSSATGGELVDGGEPTVADLRQHIANDLQMSDSAELIEIIVANKILDVNLKLRVVHQVLWRNYLIDGAAHATGVVGLLAGSTAAAYLSAGTGLSLIFSSGEVEAGNMRRSINGETPLALLPPMVATYRLAGVDGEATEDTVHVGDLADPETPEQASSSEEAEKLMEAEYGITRVVTEGRGVFALLRSVQHYVGDVLRRIRRDDVGCKNTGDNLARKEFKRSAPCQSLTLLRHCSKLASNRRKLLYARAPTILLTLLMDVLKSLEDSSLRGTESTRSNPTAEILQELIEILTSDISTAAPSESGPGADEGGYESDSMTQDAASMPLLLKSIETISLSVPLRGIVGKLLPFLTYGHVDLSRELAQHFDRHIDFDALGEEEDDDDDEEEHAQKKQGSVMMRTLVQTATTLPTTDVCNALRLELTNCGFLERLALFIFHDVPKQPPPWAPALWEKGKKPTKRKQLEDGWRAYFCRRGIRTAFQIITGISKKHVPTQARLCAASDFLRTCHWLETTSDSAAIGISTNGLGLVAETLLDEMMDGGEEMKKVVEAVRQKTRLRKKELAQERRSKALMKMSSFGGTSAGLTTGDTARVSSGTVRDVASSFSSAVLRFFGDSNSTAGTSSAAVSASSHKAKGSKSSGEKSSTKPAWLAEAESIEDESGLTCAVCQEGSTLQPSELLGLYAYVKKIAVSIDQFGTRAGIDGTNLLKALQSVAVPTELSGDRVSAWFSVGKAAGEDLEEATPSTSLTIGTLGGRRALYTTTVSAGNAIHMSCHRRARQADRSHPKAPKSEWEGAALRNSRVNCNVILPLVSSRSSKVSLMAVDAALTDHQAAVANLLGSSPKSMLWTVLHDVRMLLLRVAYAEPLGADCGGGSLSSNCVLLFYELLMADMYDQDAQVDQPAQSQHARGLSAGFLAACSLENFDDESASRLKLAGNIADAAPMAALTSIVFHNGYGDGDTESPSDGEDLKAPHPARQWIVGRDLFLSGLIMTAGRRRALGVDGSGYQVTRTSGRKRAASFAEWENVHANELKAEGEETEREYEGLVDERSRSTSAKSSETKREGAKPSIDDFQNAFRPMFTLFAIMDQLSAEFTLGMNDSQIKESAEHLVRVIEDCQRAKSIHELIEKAKITMHPDIMMKHLQKGMVAA